MKLKEMTFASSEGSISIYYENKFRGAIESTSMSWDILTEIDREIQELTKYKQAFNKIYDEGLGFYGNIDNYDTIGNSKTRIALKDCDAQPWGNVMFIPEVGGKKAREMQAEFKKLRGE